MVTRATITAYQAVRGALPDKLPRLLQATKVPSRLEATSVGRTVEKALIWLILKVLRSSGVVTTSDAVPSTASDTARANRRIEPSARDMQPLLLTRLQSMAKMMKRNA